MSSRPPVDPARNRFFLMQGARIGGTIICLLGLLLWQGDTFVRGGSIIGFPVALAGIAISFLAPRHLARKWRTPPAPPEG